MSLLQIDDRKLDASQLARLTQQGPVIVTHDGKPLFVAHTVVPEWLEALAAEESKPGPMQLKEYADLYNIPLDAEAYQRDSRRMSRLHTRRRMKSNVARKSGNAKSGLEGT